MNANRRQLLPLVASVFLFLSSGALYGGVFNLRPTMVSLRSDALTSTVTLSNPGSKELLIETTAFRWTQHDGEDRLDPTADLIAVPPVFTLEPGGEQTIRVGLVRVPDHREQEVSWRLLFSEVPVAESSRFGVTIALEISIPVFFTPTEVEPGAGWMLQPHARADAIELALENTGSAHLKVFKLRLYADRGASPIATLERGAYVLPGATHRWTVDLELPPRRDMLVVEADTNMGTVEATLAMPSLTAGELPPSSGF